MTNGSVLPPNMPGEPAGMPGQRDPGDRRLLGEKFFDHFDRDVTVDHVGVALDEHGVAALEVFRHPRLAADLGEVIGRLHLDRETVLAQIVRIALATLA